MSQYQHTKLQYMAKQFSKNLHKGTSKVTLIDPREKDKQLYRISNKMSGKHAVMVTTSAGHVKGGSTAIHLLHHN